MMNNTWKNLFKLNPGTVIEGKWHRNKYTIIKELGYGANGTVFLATFHSKQVALKMSNNGMSITSEVNVLKSFAKVQGYHLGPSLMDVDDWVTRTGNISFYVMEYIHGPDLLTYLKEKDESWKSVLIIQLLKDLQTLHTNGWVFGDLKPENLIITGPPTRIRCIDVGGTTIQGRAIKEFTEFYDRGYWGLGSRKAEPTYDLFAVSMVMMNISYPKRFSKKAGGLEQLKEMIQQKQELHDYRDILLGAFTGKYQSANEMRKDLIEMSNTQTSRTPVKKQRNVQSTRAKTSGQAKKKKKRSSGLIESVLLIIIISLLYFLYMYGQLV